ncbi:hypothetical protein ACJX0J_007256 [Zea mays]
MMRMIFDHILKILVDKRKMHTRFLHLFLDRLTPINNMMGNSSSISYDEYESIVPTLIGLGSTNYLSQQREGTHDGYLVSVPYKYTMSKVVGTVLNANVEAMALSRF